MNHLKNDQTSRLIAAFMVLKTEDEWYSMLEDLCTVREIQDLSQRFDVACMLNSKITYNEISQATGVSTATISRVNRSLAFGAGGYDIVFERLGIKKNDKT